MDSVIQAEKLEYPTTPVKILLEALKSSCLARVMLLKDRFVLVCTTSRTVWWIWIEKCHNCSQNICGEKMWSADLIWTAHYRKMYNSCSWCYIIRSRLKTPESCIDKAIDEVEFDCISSPMRTSYVGHILVSLLFRLTVLFVLCLSN